jgi:uncharacterized protein YjbI with pentapeptide repeats
LSKIELKASPIARSNWEIDHGLEEELKIVESKIEILESVFEDDVDFSNTQFRKDIYFIWTSFSSKNDFLGANFAGDADFGYANFSGDADFGYANFTGDADFGHANFAGDAGFGSANFADDADFWPANFAGDADFWNANFAGDAAFWFANFSGDADFGSANFAGDAGFGSANFTGDADFGSANFADDADFGYANFTGDARFYSTEFNKVSFTRATFTTVSLYNSKFNQMNVEWSTLKDALSADGLTYIKLIKNFREIEQFEDADAAYYQYRRLSQANKEWSYSKLMDVVAGASCGYGVKPERPLIWAFGLIMLFTLVYWLGKGIKRLKGNDEEKNRVSRWAAFYNAFYFSVVTFTTVGYGDWYPKDRYRIVVMIEGVLGWLLLALFIVTLANVMIRP